MERSSVGTNRSEESASGRGRHCRWRNPAQHLQDPFLSFCLCLLFRQDLSRAAVSGAQPQNVLAAESCDGTFQHRGTAGSLANLAGDLRRKPRLGRPVHETEYLLRSLVRDETEERRLLQLHRQSLAEGLVKSLLRCKTLCTKYWGV